jgi:hypothetical protein
MTRCITRYLAISLFINCILANLYFILCIFFYKNQRVITLYGGFTVLVRMLMIKDKEIV